LELEIEDAGIRGLVQAGNTFADAGRYREAIVTFNAAIARGERRIFLNLGLSLAAMGSLELAERAFRSGADAKDLDATYELALLLEETDRVDEAKETHRYLASLHYPESILSTAWYESADGNYENAMKLIMPLTEREDEVGAIAAGMLGWRLYELGQSGNAEPLLRRGSMLYPSALLALVDLLCRSDRRAEAAQIIERAALNGVEGASRALEHIEAI
jgi:hypothetical protein